MAWHIFRKDLGLLWPLIALSALAQLGLNALMFAAGQAGAAPSLMLMARLSVAVVFLAIVLTISLGVHQEPIPGTRQDWLIRPIRRLDLLLAKLLFILVAVHLPMVLGDLAEAMAEGFSWDQAAMAALGRSALVFVTISLPAFGFAAITRSTAQFIGVGVAYLIAAIAAAFLLSSLARLGGDEQATNPLAWTGVAWIPQTAARLALAAGAIIALLALYLRRRVALAWAVLPLFAVLSALAVLMPWGAIFAVQEAASAATTGPALAMRIDPQAPRYALKAGESPDDYSPGAGQVQLRGRAAGDIDVENKVRRGQREVTIFVPVRIAGLPAGALAWADRAMVTLRAPSGQLLFQGRGEELKQDRASPGLAYEAVRLPALVYEAAKDKPMVLTIDYSLSVLRPGAAVAAPALGADALLPGLGRCTTERDSDGDDIEMKCHQPGRSPSCVSVALDDPAAGRRNPETLICAPDYSPVGARLFPDAISRFEVEAPFRDRLGLAQYPVGAGQLARSRLLVTRYDASAHLTRRLSAAQVRLADWEAR
jgi:hypothetical protein